MSIIDISIIPPVIAHRGASFYAPENTLSSFMQAIQLGLKWVEYDVAQAACGEAVIFHDELLDRTSNGSGELAYTTLAIIGEKPGASLANTIAILSRTIMPIGPE